MPKKKENLSYEQAMKKLEDILHRIENEDVPVDELVELVEKSTTLVKECKKKLQGVTDKIEVALDDLD